MSVTRMPCPTCSGPSRETVGMVCQTCGTDYGPPAAPGDHQQQAAEVLGLPVPVPAGLLPYERQLLDTFTTALAAAEQRGARRVAERMEPAWLQVREAHDWQCDCDPDDPCRVRIALLSALADLEGNPDD